MVMAVPSWRQAVRAMLKRATYAQSTVRSDALPEGRRRILRLFVERGAYSLITIIVFNIETCLGLVRCFQA